MAQSTIHTDYTTQETISDHYTGGEADGVQIHCRRYGNVVCISCGDGTLKSAYAAKATIATLPEGFRPPALLSVTDFGTSGTRVRIMGSGSIQPFAAKDAGDTVIFTATYVVDS